MPVSLEDVLCKVAEHVTFKGEKHPVRAISATGIQLAQRIDTENSPTFDELFALARKLCPSLPEEAWSDLDGELVGLVIGLSQQRVRDVQAELPNSSGPVTTNPAEETATNASHAS